jgi:hypothetical protein
MVVVVVGDMVAPVGLGALVAGGFGRNRQELWFAEPG